MSLEIYLIILVICIQVFTLIFLSNNKKNDKKEKETFKKSGIVHLTEEHEQKLANKIGIE